MERNIKFVLTHSKENNNTRNSRNCCVNGFSEIKLTPFVMCKLLMLCWEHLQWTEARGCVAEKPNKLPKGFVKSYITQDILCHCLLLSYICKHRSNAFILDCLWKNVNIKFNKWQQKAFRGLFMQYKLYVPLTFLNNSWAK